VKEAHLKHIPDWIPLFDYDILIGTSAHSIESALKSSVLYRPHYYFVGTCFLTESHPEKSEAELEGPLLPGKIKESLRIDGRGDTNYSIPVFAIGGIDETNCCIPIEAGADGVAVIRSVLKADQPEYVVSIMYKIMKTASMKRQRDLQIDSRV
jgi:thiamine-phosphate pyrophosphorylase